MSVVAGAGNPPELDIVLPVYREASSIAGTLREIDRAVSPLAHYRFIVSADAGSDDTISVLRGLVNELPLLLDASSERRGYAGAMRSALRLVRAPHVLCIDSDGQYDPADIGALWGRRTEADIVSGWRVQRADPLMRRVGSRAFALAYRIAFPVPLHDPSCSISLLSRHVCADLEPRLGNLPEGFWWELNGVAYRRKHSFAEVPVRHRRRAGGSTQIFSPTRLPGVIWRQFSGLARIAAGAKK